MVEQTTDVSSLATEHVETYLVFRVEQALKQADVCGCRQCRSNALIWYMFWAGSDASRIALIPEGLRPSDPQPPTQTQDGMSPAV